MFRFVALALLLPGTALAGGGPPALNVSASDMHPGEDGSFTVDGAGVALDDGAAVWFMKGSAEGPGPCPAYLSGACWGITSPRFIQVAWAIGGTAVWDVYVDGGMGVGTSGAFQAAVADPGGARISNAITVTVTDPAPPLPDTCQNVAGIDWCFHPSECGVACNDTCGALGLTPMADKIAWLKAQDTEGECVALAYAFGNSEPVNMGGFTHACLEDSSGDHTPGGGPVGQFYCSTYDGCPLSHLTNMDGIGTPCGGGSRLSICPCE
jgi:hypothetical protein